MRGEVLNRLIMQAMAQSGDLIHFVWQGGEPTLMGLPFFRKAVQLQQEYGYGRKIENSLQTNGLLLDEKWAEFLRSNHFLVGLSIDGPAHIHDRYRHVSGGGESFSRVLASAELLIDRGVDVNAMTLVNNYSVRFPEEIYEFHKGVGLSYMQFIPCVETNPENTTQVAPFSVSAEAFGLFLCKTFDLWLSDFVNNFPSTDVRFFSTLLHSYVGLPSPDCTCRYICGMGLVVEYDGSIFACDFFVEPSWKLGNLKNNRLIELLNSSKQQRFGMMKTNLPDDCIQCDWLKHCFGGCIKDRLRDPQDRKLNHFCRSFRMFFEHADPHLKRLAEEWEEQREHMGAVL